MEQGVALTGRTLLACRVLPLVSYVAPRSVMDDDDRQQRALLVWPLHSVHCVGGPVITIAHTVIVLICYVANR